MLTGEEPAEASVRGLETYLNTVIDHGLNASTFAARVVISTESDIVSAVTAAVGALKGPLHGVGIPRDLFTPTFAVARAGGWTAHCLEQLQDNRLIRPRAW